MTKIDDRVDRLERVVAELADGWEWTPLRGHGRNATNEFLEEVHLARAAEASERRRRALEAELAGLGEAA
jgi:hypothetical protein